MAVSKSDIRFYLTSVEPELAQSNYAQSIGGYISTSTVYPRNTTAASIGRESSSFSVSSFTSLSGLSYVGINSEIIQTETIAANAISIVERGINNSNFFHGSGDLVYGLSVGNLFNEKFNDDLKQYRCIAIKNEHASDSAINMTISLRQNTVNNSSVIKIAVETPQNDYRISTATGGSKITLIDTSLVDLFDDGHFDTAILKILSGSNINQSRIISSFDGSTGTFVLDSSLPFIVGSGISYELQPGPAQRVASGLISPAFGSQRVSALSKPTGLVTLQSNEDRSNTFSEAITSIGIDVNSNRDHGADLQFNDVIYIWLERALIKDSASFDLNSVILTLNYFTA